MSTTASPIVSTTREIPRVRVFVDYWNLQITLNERDARTRGIKEVRFKVDWRGFPQWVANKAAERAGVTKCVFDGAIIYASYNPNSLEGRKFNQWATTWLDR